MKKLALATALSLAATTAFAGGMAEPAMEPEVVKAATSSSSGGIIVPLLLLLVVAAAIASSGSDTPT
jgi:C4-dicarboxylate transporter